MTLQDKSSAVIFLNFDNKGHNFTKCVELNELSFSLRPSKNCKIVIAICDRGQKELLIYFNYDKKGSVLSQVSKIFTMLCCTNNIFLATFFSGKKRKNT